MSAAALRRLLLERGFSVEDIDTNNGWGFGGWSGQRYTRGEETVEIGEYSYRHSGTSNRTLYNNGNEIHWVSTSKIIKILENENN